MRAGFLGVMKKQNHIKRKPGSCRFSPYYKLEWFDKELYVWKPRQVRYLTKEEAVSNQTSDLEWRVFEVTEDGRELV